MDKLRIKVDNQIVTNELIEDLNDEIKDEISYLKKWTKTIIDKQTKGLINLQGIKHFDKYYYLCQCEEHINFLTAVIEALLGGIPNADFIQLKEDYENRCIDEHNRSIGDYED